MAKDKRKKRRVAVGIQLVVGEDDTLIQWWSSLPAGQRSQVLKQALYAMLGYEPPQAVQAASGDLVGLRQEWEKWSQNLLADLPGYIHQLVEQAIKEKGVVLSSSSQDRLTANALANRAERLKQAKW